MKIIEYIRILFGITLILPILILYVLHVPLYKSHVYALSIYGIVIVFYNICQWIFAYLNYKRMLKYSNLTTLDYTKKVGVVVVGYRENLEYFKKCLLSIKQLIHVNYIVVVIDGNDNQDIEMTTVFKQVFPQGATVQFTNLPSNLELREMNHTNNIVCTTSIVCTNNILCINQYHMGKRYALHTGIQYLLHNQTACDYILLVDSDTILDSNAVIECMNVFHNEPKAGAVTGYVSIFNIMNTLTLMSSLRYWLAFNIERGAQSFFGKVTCVSGPLGMYKTEVLEQVITKWFNQTFLNMRCSYGDDRHLTNCVLSLGHSVCFTPFSKCWTETPETIDRWCQQQTRWAKSFFRETWVLYKFIHQTSVWTVLESIYTLFYPFFIIYIMFHQLYSFNYQYLLFWVFAFTILGSIKSVAALLATRETKFILFPLYILYYLFGIVPCKIAGLITLFFDNSWITSPREFNRRKFQYVIFFPIIWFIVIILGIILNVIHQIGAITTTHVIMTSVVLWIFIQLFITAKLAMSIQTTSRLDFARV